MGYLDASATIRIQTTSIAIVALKIPNDVDHKKRIKHPYASVINGFDRVAIDVFHRAAWSGSQTFCTRYRLARLAWRL